MSPPLQVAADELLGERILDVALDGAAQRPRAVRAVLAGLLDDPVDHFGRQRDAAACGRPGSRSAASTSSRMIAPQVVVGQRLEDDDLVDAVDELGVEGPLHLAEHHVGDALVDRARCRPTGTPATPSSG